MRFVLAVLLGAGLLSAAACVGEDPDITPPADTGTPEGSTPSDDGGPNADAGGDGNTGPGDGVQGNVIDLGALPVANASVRINGVTVMTDAAGQFTIPKVNVPYDVDVVSSLDPTLDGTTKFVMSVRGVTTRTPIIHVKYTGPERRSTTSGSGGSLSWGGNNNRLKSQWYNTVGLPNGRTSPGTYAITPIATSDEVHWDGKSSSQGVWLLLHWQEATAQSGTPTGFSGVQRVPQVLTDNMNATVPNWYMKPVTTVDLSGSTTFPAGATVREIGFGVKLDDADRVGYTFDTNTYPATASFTSKMPSGAGLTAQVIATARMPNGANVAAKKEAVVWKTNLPTNSTGVTLAFPTPPTLTSPADASTMKVTDTIKWSGGSGPYRMEIDCKGYKAWVVTMATEAVLPTGIGAWPATTTACTAKIASWGHVKTVDETVAVDAPYKTTSSWAGDGSMGSETNAFSSGM